MKAQSAGYKAPLTSPKGEPMYLGIAHWLARWAHDSAEDIYSKATFSTIATFLSGTTTLLSAVSTIQTARIARGEIEQAFAQSTIGQRSGPRAA